MIEQPSSAAAAPAVGALLPELDLARREIARWHAREARALAQAEAAVREVPDSEAEFVRRSAAAEIAAQWRVSDRSVQRRMAESAMLVDLFPATLESLEAGRISPAHVRVILDAGARIERAELRAEYEASVLAYAESESATRLAPVARRRAEWFLESTIEERHRAARTQRRVWVTDLEDGMAELGAILPAVLAHGVYDRLTRLAHASGVSGAAIGEGSVAGGPVAEGPVADAVSTPDSDDRSLDEKRADVFSDLLLASDPIAHVGTTETGLGAIRGTVQVTVPALSLVGSPDADPFDATTMAGLVPIDAETARRLAADAPGWDRILTHPVTGAVLAVDRYRPSDQMRRHLRVRDQHCRFPGCRVRAGTADLDHTVDHQFGGPTASANLAHLCRRHHSLKHQTAWSVRQRAHGALEWTSPAGRRYVDSPVSSVWFSPDAECDPVPGYAAAPF